jgi:thiaminase
LPIIKSINDGNLTKALYISFLTQWYHILKHTLPLILATQSRLTEETEWLTDVIGEFTEQMASNEELILNDIAVCGGDIEQVRHSRAHMTTELMVSYAYDTVNRINPLGILGMHHVLEGAVLSLAHRSADNIGNTSLVPKDALTYLYTHGSLLQDNADVFIGVMNRIDRSEDRNQIIRSAQIFYKLYADIFLSLSPELEK